MEFLWWESSTCRQKWYFDVWPIAREEATACSLQGYVMLHYKEIASQ